MEVLFGLLLIFSIFIFVVRESKLKRKYEREEEDNYLRLSKEREKEIRQLGSEVEHLENQRRMIGERLNETISHEKDIVQEKLTALYQKSEHERESLLAAAKVEVESLRREELDKLKEEHQKVLSTMLEEEEQLANLLAPLRQELVEYKAKRSAINESVQRELSLEMDKNFHRIQLSAEAKEDMSYLLSIEQKIHNKEILRKLIYESYLRPPLLEMQKRVLDNRDMPGVYKITDSIGRIYIGKSTKVKTRWQAHCKEAIGIGGVSHQEIHNALRERGWDDFSFELLEECSKEELSSREAFYINFYESSKMGYNMKGGNKTC